MSQIILIRHAETNLRGTFCGHSNPSLNENGWGQLPILLDGLRSYDIASIHSSELQRALSTAEAISAHFAIPILPHAELREIDFGTWEGLTWQQIEQRDRAYARRWVEEYPSLPAPGGERYEAFRARILNAFAKIVAMPSRGDRAIVTHAGVMQLLLTELGGETTERAYERTRTYCCVVPLVPRFAVQHA